MKTIFALFLVLLLGRASAAVADPTIRLGGAYRGPVFAPRVVPRGKGAYPDIRAYWMYWFEHNKEAILADRLTARRRLPRPAPHDPVEDATRREVVFPLLVNALDDIHPLVRNAAVIALGKFGGPAAAEHLLKALDYPEAPLRQDAMLALGLTGDRGTATLALVRSLAGCQELDGDRYAPPDPAYAALGLALLGQPDETIPVLLKKYREALHGADDPTLASCLATALGLLGSELLIEELAWPIRSRKGHVTQVHACHALGRLGGERARTWLFRALSSRNGDVQAASVLALSRWNDKAVIGYLKGKPGLKSGKRMSKLFAIWSLSRAASRLVEGHPMRDAVRSDLVRYAESIYRDNYTSMHAAVALAAVGDTIANDTLLGQLEQGGKYVVENSSAMAMALGLSGDIRASKSLTKIARNSDLEPDLRGYACFALGLLKDPSGLEVIRRLVDARRTPNDILRSSCWALGLMGDSTDVPRLLALLARESKNFLAKDDDLRTLHYVRGAAAIAIGLIGDEAAVAPLVEMAKTSKSATTVAFAIAALGCLVDRDPVPRIPLLFANCHYRRMDPIFSVVMSTL